MAKECRSRQPPPAGPVKTKPSWGGRQAPYAPRPNGPFKKDYRGGEGKRLLPEAGRPAIDTNKVDVYPYPHFSTEVLINSRPVDATIDSGAGATIVDHAFFKTYVNLGREAPVLFKEDILVGAGGNTLQYWGDVDVQIGFKSKGSYHYLPLRVKLVENLGANVLLGRDFISRTGMIIDLALREVTYRLPERKESDGPVWRPEPEEPIVATAVDSLRKGLKKARVDAGGQSSSSSNKAAVEPSEKLS